MKKLNKVREEMAKLETKKSLTSFAPVAAKVLAGVAVTAVLAVTPDVAKANTDSNTHTNKIEAEAGIHNGVAVDYKSFKAQDLGHIFESQNNPLARSAGGQNLGLYQMDVGATLGNFLEEVKEKYPTLYKTGRTAAARKGAVFLNEWAKIYKSSKVEEFNHDQFMFMKKTRYDSAFDKLKAINNLNLEERGEVLQGAMMSALNQFSDANVIRFAKQAMVLASIKASKNKKAEVPTSYIIDSFYKAREDFVRNSQRMSPSLKKGLISRFSQENKLAQTVQKYQERVAANAERGQENSDYAKRNDLQVKAEKIPAKNEYQSSVKQFKEVSNVSAALDIIKINKSKTL